DALRQRLLDDLARADRAERVLGEAEAELALAETDELLQGHLDALAQRTDALVGGQRPYPGVHGPGAPRERRHHQTVPEDDGPLVLAHADGQEARLLAEGDDLEDVEEGQVLEVAVETHALEESTPRRGSRRPRGPGEQCGPRPPPPGPP